MIIITPHHTIRRDHRRETRKGQINRWNKNSFPICSTILNICLRMTTMEIVGEIEKKNFDRFEFDRADNKYDRQGEREREWEKTGPNSIAISLIWWRRRWEAKWLFSLLPLYHYILIIIFITIIRSIVVFFLNFFCNI